MVKAIVKRLIEAIIIVSAVFTALILGFLLLFANQSTGNLVGALGTAGVLVFEILLFLAIEKYLWSSPSEGSILQRKAVKVIIIAVPAAIAISAGFIIYAALSGH